MAELNVIKFKRPEPSNEEARVRLDRLFEDFVTRGVSPQDMSELIFAYGVSEIINYSAAPENGLETISKLLNNNFDLEMRNDVIFDPDY
jgi:hypothetical protein